MPQIPYKAGADFPKLPTHTPILCKVVEANFVTEPDPFAEEGGPVDRDVVKVVLEALDAEYLKTRIWATFSASIHERSRLRPFIQACHSTELSLDELKAFDTDALVGKQVMVVGEYDDKDPEHRWLRPKTFIRAPRVHALSVNEAKATTKSATSSVDLDF